jgi:ABC-type glycerol-3-phosphate transport system substrate-binding protein
LKNLRYVLLLLLVFGISNTTMGEGIKNVLVLTRPSMADWYTDSANRFNAIQDQYHVTVEVLPSGDGYQMRDKLNILAATGLLPDVGGTVNVEWSSHLLAAGHAIDIGEMMISSSELKSDDLFPASLEYGSLPGTNQVAVLPYMVGSTMTLFNTQFYNEAGLLWPDQSWQSNDWTRSTFLKNAQKLTKDTNGDGLPDQFGVAGDAWWGSIFCWLLSYGQFTDEGVTRALVDQPVMRESLQFFFDLNLTHKVSGGTFVNKNAAMTPLHLDGAIAAADKGVPVGLAPNPYIEKDRQPQHLLTGTGTMLFNSKNPQGGWAFIEYLYSRESMLKLVEKGYLTVRRDCFQPWLNAVDKKIANPSIVADILNMATRLPWNNPRWASMNLTPLLYNSATLKVMYRGEKSVNEWAMQTADTVNALISEYDSKQAKH